MMMFGEGWHNGDGTQKKLRLWHIGVMIDKLEAEVRAAAAGSSWGDGVVTPVTLFRRVPCPCLFLLPFLSRP